jgi:hypothetical protein
VSFLPDAPGESNALVLRFVDKRQGQNVIIIRRLRGMAITPSEKSHPQPSRLPSSGEASERAHYYAEQK